MVPPARSDGSCPRPTTREELSALYDALYARAIALCEVHDPCEVRDGRCARGRAHGSPDVGFCCSVSPGDPDFPGPLGSCAHLGPRGCTVQALRCRLWFCRHVGPPTVLVPLRVRKKTEPFRTLARPEALALLREAQRLGFVVHRGTKHDDLDAACRKWGITS